MYINEGEKVSPNHKTSCLVVFTPGRIRETDPIVRAHTMNTVHRRLRVINMIYIERKLRPHVSVSRFYLGT